MDQILLGKGEQPVSLLSKYGNRHGLVAGATGTGKTISLLVIAEGFSRIGVPVFMADVKGDVAGLAFPGTPSDKLTERVTRIGMQGYSQEGSPVVFWDLMGKLGHPVRTTVSEMGPNLLGRILELNEIQSGVLEIAFKLADDQGLLLLDLDDLRSLLAYVADNKEEITTHYGLVSNQSIGAIQRGLLSLEREGGTGFFGEPALELNDIMRTDLSGKGIINILAANELILKPRLYSSFLLWLLSELFENLPEIGDIDKPRLVFIFDEAHLLFNDAPPSLKQRVEQVVRLIRSKGVGVYFCSQFPDDVPGEILGQLGNRVQHALRAYTPRDQKAVRTAAETFASNPKINVAEVISQLAVGEALVSTLQEKGVPMPVERTLMCPPRCRMGAITTEERTAVRGRSPVSGKYDTPLNRESAYEILSQRAAVEPPAPPPTPAPRQSPKSASSPRQPPRTAPQPRAAEPSGSSRVMDILLGTKRRQGVVESVAKSPLGRQILRGVLGGIMGGPRSR